MNTLLFGLGSLILIVVSRKSITRPRAHGFYRFVAWEAILGLALMNASAWFREPFSWHQLISWPLLFICLVPLILGIVQLRKASKTPARARDEEELFGFERTTIVVKDGIFRLIRHPLYSSLLILAWGVFFKDPSIPGAFLILLATLALTLAGKMDEAECLQVFGADYRDYMRGTRMFIPYIL